MKNKLMRLVYSIALIFSTYNFNASAKVNVVGGQEVLNTDAISRFTVAITLSSKGQCSGTLIRPRIVLFAAHCTRNSNHFTVSFGSKPDGFKLIKGVGVIILKDTLGEGDLALLVLEKEAPKEFSPIEIGITNSEDKMIAAGFGKYSPGLGGTFEGVLRKVELPVVSIGPTIRLRNRIMEKENHFGVNVGDSGGPVLRKKNQNYEIVGVHSQLLSSNTPRDLYVSDHVNLENHLDWICDQIEAIEAGYKESSTSIAPTACSSR